MQGVPCVDVPSLMPSKRDTSRIMDHARLDSARAHEMAHLCSRSGAVVLGEHTKRDVPFDRLE